MRGFGTQALTDCDVKNTSTRTTAGQCKGQFNGAMERYTWVRFAGKLTGCQTTHIAMVSISAGRWRSVWARAEDEHTSLAVLSWISQPSKLATPVTWKPPPCKPRERGQAPWNMRGFDLAHNSRGPARTRHNSEHTSGASRAGSICRNPDRTLHA